MTNHTLKSSIRSARLKTILTGLGFGILTLTMVQSRIYATPGPTFLSVDSSSSKGFPDVVFGDFNHDGKIDAAYVTKGLNNSLVIADFTGSTPSVAHQETISLNSLAGANQGSILIAGDQNGDGLTDLVIFEAPGSSTHGFRLVQRDSSSLGSGASANYASEVGDNTLQSIDVDGGKAFNESGTKTSLAAYYAGFNESLWSRNNAAIGSGTWCRQEFDNAGSTATFAVGCLGDYNGDGVTDYVRAYPGSNDELGVRGQSGGFASCSSGFSTPNDLDRVIIGFGQPVAHCVRISTGDIGTPSHQHALIAATPSVLKACFYSSSYYANATTFNSGYSSDVTEVIDTLNGATQGVNNFNVVRVADLDGDGIQEVIAGTYDGKLYAYYRSNHTTIEGNGTWKKVDLLAGAVGISKAPITGLAIGDLLGDGKIEVAMSQSQDPTSAPSAVQQVVIISGLNDVANFPLYNPPAPGPTFATLNTERNSGFPDVVVGDFDHDGKMDVAYLSKGQNNTLIIADYSGTSPALQNQEIIPLSSLAGANQGNLLVAGDQNGDGLTDLVVFEAPGSSTQGFRLVQRDSSSLGSGTSANYVAEVGDNTLQSIDASGGKAFNETGTKTSLAVYYAGVNESLWSRNTAAIGSGTWCRQEFDNAGSTAMFAVGCLGDYNGDGVTDYVRAYPGSNDELGVRGQPGDGFTTCSGTFGTPDGLDRVIQSFGQPQARCVQISSGSVGTPSHHHALVGATPSVLRVSFYSGDYGNSSVFEAYEDVFEVVDTLNSVTPGLNNFSVVRVADLNGDGIQEIIAGTYDGKLYAYYRTDTSVPEGNGTWRKVDLLAGFSAASRAPITGLAIGDLLGNGQVEVVASQSLDSSSALGVTQHVVVIGGLNNLYGFPIYTASAGPTFTTLNSSQNNGFPDVALGDFDHDGQTDIAYVSQGQNNALVLADFTGDSPAVVNQEEIPLTSLAGAHQGNFLMAGDQNGDGLTDLLISEAPGSSVQGFRLVQRDNSPLGSGTSANYAAEVGDSTLQPVDIDVGKAFNETGTKTSLATYYANANESLWSRNTAAIGSGTWCRQEFDNAGSGCNFAVGCLGDYNGDGFTDYVRAYPNCNDEIGVRSQPGGFTACSSGFSTPDDLDRVIIGFGQPVARCVRISTGDIGTPSHQHALIAATPSVLKACFYSSSYYGNATVFNSGYSSDVTEVIDTLNGVTQGVNNFSVVRVADLNGDGIQEIIAGTYDGKLYAYYRSNSSTAEGSGTWKKVDLLAGYSGVTQSPITGLAVGDLLGNGKIEVVMSQSRDSVSAPNSTQRIVVINGLDNLTSYPLYNAPASSSLTFASLNSQQNSGFSDVVVGDFNHDGKMDVAYVSKGEDNTLVIADFSGNALANQEIIPLASLAAANQGGFLVAGDQNGDGLTDLTIFESPGSSTQGFRLVQRDSTALGSGTSANYAAEVGDNTLQSIDVSGGKAFNETGAKTSMAAYYAGANESIWSRDTAAIGSGAWCRMEFDNAGSGCDFAVGCLGDYNGDNLTDYVRAYSGCNNELGVRGQTGGINECSSGLNQPANLDRVLQGFGTPVPRCVQISTGDIGVPTHQHALVAATPSVLKAFFYPSANYGSSSFDNKEDGDVSEIVDTLSGVTLGVNNFSVVRVADLNNDGIQEIIAGTYDGKLYAYYRSNTTAQVGYGAWRKVDLLAGLNGSSSAPITGLAIGDLKGDGTMKLVMSQSQDEDSAPGAVQQVVVVGGLNNLPTLPIFSTTIPPALPLPVLASAGPSSRKTGIAIAEIMYKPLSSNPAGNMEFVELYNSNPYFHDISGYKLISGSITFTFPANTVIPAGASLVVAAAPSDVQSFYNIENVFGPYSGSLKANDTLQLLDEQGAILLTVPYANVYPWPVAATGTGHSIVLSDPSYGEGDPRAWSISAVKGGSPGQQETLSGNNVVLNEILAHSENLSVTPYVELYNHSAVAQDISGWVLTDDATANKFVLPDGTTIDAGGFLSFTQTQLGFNLKPGGGTVYLEKPDMSAVVDAYQYEAQADGIPNGRWPDGANAHYPLASQTPGNGNGSILIGDIVINELMYNPISGNDDDQYIELYNKSSGSINLDNWSFVSGVTYTFPAGTTLASHGYLVVGRNKANLLAKYTSINVNNTLGNFSGKLSHSGERVALARPVTLPDSTTINVVEDEVTYGTGGHWGKWSDGGGSSLELIDAESNHRLASNWRDSDESQKSAWSTIEATGTLDNGKSFDPGLEENRHANNPNESLTAGDCQYAQIGLLDEGECLVDNIEVIKGGNNYVSNPTFESGLANWDFQGCMVRSSQENSGYSSSHSLHIRCTDRMWTGVNSCQVSLNANDMASGDTVTLRFKARWLHGYPVPLLRLNGNWLEATGIMPLPNNLGTPGAANSTLVTEAGPAIYDVVHLPAIPAANQPIVVTARAHDSTGLPNLTLSWRPGDSTSYTDVVMKDDGADGDAIANDGIFSATIPGQSGGATASFYISAFRSSGPVTRFPELENDAGPIKECTVGFGDANPASAFGAYHVWVTSENITRWTSMPDLSNEPQDCTFVCGNRVIYNMQIHYSGSPWHQGLDSVTGNHSACSYRCNFPEDDQYLGATSFEWHAPGNSPGDDPYLQSEQLAYTFLRALHVPWSYRRDVAVYINGWRRGDFLEDSQRPDGDVVKEHFPNDDDGFLYYLNSWYEFAPSPSGTFDGFSRQSWANLLPYTTSGGAKKSSRYRWNFEWRRAPDFGVNIFTNLFSLIDAASSYGDVNYVANMQNMADMENWMRVFAANHAAGNQDCYGSLTGQNLYFYLGATNKFSLLMWDFNQVFYDAGAFGHIGAGDSILTFNDEDSNTSAIFSNPTFRRMYWRALKELINGPLDPTVSGPLLDAKHAAFVADGVNAADPSALKDWLATAQSSISQQMMDEEATTFTLNSSVSINQNIGTISGTAPFDVKAILINGVAWPVTWTSVQNWSVSVPLQPGTTTLNVAGVDINYQPISGDNGSVTATYGSSLPSPVGNIAINEIMYNPLMANAQYVELHNNSATVAFDLSGWQLQGLSYTFPAGSFIAPSGYIILAANRTAFADTYGATIPVFDTFSGTLQSNGEILTLLQPVSGGSPIVVTKVQYSNALPWPAGANGLGSSLELIDSAQDNWRVGNWAAGSTAPTFSPGAVNSAYASLPAFPSLWLNEVEANNVSGILNSAGNHTPWVEIYNSGSSQISLSGLYLSKDYNNLTAWAFPSGATINPGEFKVIFLDGQTSLLTLTELHANFTLTAGTGSIALTRIYNGQPQVLDYIDYNSQASDHSFGSLPDGQSFSRQDFPVTTPGFANNGSLPVFINEWMGNNSTLVNPQGGSKKSDWFELYNSSSATVYLNGFYLTDDLSNPTKFKIPAGYSIPGHGFLLVWADNTPSATVTADLHTNFKLNKTAGAIGLFRSDGIAIDSKTYSFSGGQEPNVSQGRYPDGGPSFYRMPTSTPRAGNVIPSGATPSLVVGTLPPTAPKLNGVNLNGNQLTFNCALASGQIGQIEFTSSLNPTSWSSVGPILTGDGNVHSFTNSLPATTEGFYRMRVVQP